MALQQAKRIIIDCSPNWSQISRVLGPCLRPGGSLLTQRALETCSLAPGSRIADIGCGAGGTLEHLERTGLYRSVGLDYSEILLGEAASRLVSGRLVQGRAEILPFKSRSFDALFCECVFSILEDGAAALQECGRVLKEGGFLIISDLFTRFGPGWEPPGANSDQLRTEGLPLKEDVLRPLTALGFSLLLWEEHERLLKEFVARMILAGGCIPDLWTHACGSRKPAHTGVSYFLLAARKAESRFQFVEDREDNGYREGIAHG